MRNKTSKLFYSILYPALFVSLLWIIQLFEYATNNNFSWYGIYPRTVHGLIGIFTAPLVHGSFDHLASNSLPLLITGTTLLYFYRSIAFQVFCWLYIMTGIWVWASARESYHIGASCVLYGLVAFLFFSGVFRKDTRLLALSMFVVFLYGGTVWGMLPLRSGISWESHLMGALAGLITAYNFRKEGPLPHKYDLGDDEENELIDVSGEQYHETDDEQKEPVTVVYTVIPQKSPDNNSPS